MTDNTDTGGKTFGNPPNTKSEILYDEEIYVEAPVTRGLEKLRQVLLRKKIGLFLNIYLYPTFYLCVMFVSSADLNLLQLTSRK